MARYLKSGSNNLSASICWLTLHTLCVLRELSNISSELYGLLITLAFLFNGFASVYTEKSIIFLSFCSDDDETK